VGYCIIFFVCIKGYPSIFEIFGTTMWVMFKVWFILRMMDLSIYLSILLVLILINLSLRPLALLSDTWVNLKK
jgi:hypothetical protein